MPYRAVEGNVLSYLVVCDYPVIVAFKVRLKVYKNLANPATCVHRHLNSRQQISGVSIRVYEVIPIPLGQFYRIEPIAFTMHQHDLRSVHPNWCKNMRLYMTSLR